MRDEVSKVFGPEEINALLTTDDTLGGFLVPDDFQAELIKWEAGIAAIRPVARIISTNRDTAVFPKVAAHSSDTRYPSGFAGDWKAQAPSATSPGNPPTTQTQPTFEQERIPVHAWRPAAIEVAQETLEDSAVPLDTVLAQIIAETKAIDEDEKFRNGSGVGEPEGFLQAGIATVVTGSGTALTWGGLVDLVYTVPAQYRQRGRFVMNSLTYGKCLQMVDAGSNLIIPPNTTPNTLLGFPIIFHEGMASVAASAIPIVFGDWSQYVIAERTDLRIQRLTEAYAPNIGLLPWARLGGQVIQVGAFRTQTVST